MKKWIGLVFLIAGTAQADPNILAAINAERASKGRPAIDWNTKLEAAARGHAEDMAAKGYFDHKSLDGSEFTDRIAREGYRACFWAENIAQGQRDVAGVMKAWMNSRGHKRNILHRRAKEVAVARADGDIWVMVLGAPC